MLLAGAMFSLTHQALRAATTSKGSVDTADMQVFKKSEIFKEKPSGLERLYLPPGYICLIPGTKKNPRPEAIKI